MIYAFKWLNFQRQRPPARLAVFQAEGTIYNGIAWGVCLGNQMNMICMATKVQKGRGKIRELGTEDLNHQTKIRSTFYQ